MLAQAWEVRFLFRYALVPAIIGELTAKNMRKMSDVAIGQLAYSGLGEAICLGKRN